MAATCPGVWRTALCRVPKLADSRQLAVRAFRDRSGQARAHRARERQPVVHPAPPGRRSKHGSQVTASHWQ